MATTLRQEIGPAVDEPFAKTQAFMASVILTKLAGQLRRSRRRCPRRRPRARRPRRRRSPPACRRRRRASVAALDDCATTGRRGVEPARRGALRRSRRARRRASTSSSPRCASRCGPVSTARWCTRRDAPMPATEERIRDYLADRLGADDLALRDVAADHRRLVARDVAVRRHAGPTAASATSAGLLPAPRPGQRAAAGDVRPRHPVRGAALPRRHGGADAAPVLLRGRPGRARRAVPRDGEGAGHVPEPVGARGPALLRGRRPTRGVLPDSFTDALVALHTLDWRAAGLDFLGVPGAGRRLRPPRDRQVAGADRGVRASSPTRCSPT